MQLKNIAKALFTTPPDQAMKRTHLPVTSFCIPKRIAGRGVPLI